MFHRMTVSAAVFWLAFASGVASWAAAAGETNTTKEQPYRVTRWTTDHGLPQNRISALQQTRDGYLWIGTWFGLARFDGARFTVFDKHNTPALTNDTINALAEDTDGTLWIATADGLLSYREHRFTRWTTAEGLPHRKVWRLSASQSGGVWLQADNYVTLLKKGKFSRAWKVNTPVGDANLHSLQAGFDGWLHVLTAEAGLLISPAADELRTNFLAEPSGLGRLTAGWPGRVPGQIWVGTRAGVHQREGGAWSAVGAQELGPCFVDFLHEDRAGGLWANAKPGGLQHWDGAHWTAIDLGERLTTPAVICLSEDREGHVWLGTDQGLVQLQTRRMRTFTQRDGLPDDHVWSVCEGTNGIIWLGTKGGLSRIQNDRVVPIEVTEPRPELANRCVWPSRGGGVWIAKTGLGLFEFNNGFVERIPHRELAGGDIAALYEDRSGQLWIGTGDGVTAWRDGRVVARYSRRSGQPVGNVRCMLEDRDGAIWFGQQGQGITRLKEGQFQTFTERDGLSNNRVWAIHEDAEGTLWIGTENGLTRYREGRFFSFTRQSGLQENAVNWMLEDDFGFLWLSGLRGIYRVKREQLNAVADGRAVVVECAAFGTADGMETSETNGEGQPSGWKARDGRLWFPTVQGVVVVDPKTIQVNEVAPPVVIEQVKADHEIVFGDGAPRQSRASSGDGFQVPMKLGPGRARVMKFGFTAIAFADASRARFRYRLTGHDSSWRDGNAERVVHYTNLRPGDYRFEVTAANHHGIWNPQPSLFAFALAPHFYETWPFYGLCAVAVIGLGAGVTAYRLRWQHRLLSARHEGALAGERARIARDLHDDLGTALTGVALEIDLARRHLPNGVVTRLGESAARVRTLAERMREVVWAVNPQCDTVSSLASFLEQQAGALLSNDGVRGRFEFPEDIPPLPLDSETRHQLALGVREALTNALRHAQATEVLLGLALGEGEIVISVRDNGRGFDVSAMRPEPGHGLHNLRVRLERIGGELAITSKPGQGTSVEMRVPLQDASRGKERA